MIWSRITLTLTLSYDLELERQETQGGLAADNRGQTVDDGGADGQRSRSRSASRARVRHRLAEFFGHDASPHTLITVTRTLDTASVPIPGY